MLIEALFAIAAVSAPDPIVTVSVTEVPCVMPARAIADGPVEVLGFYGVLTGTFGDVPVGIYQGTDCQPRDAARRYLITTDFEAATAAAEGPFVIGIGPTPIVAPPPAEAAPSYSFECYTVPPVTLSGHTITVAECTVGEWEAALPAGARSATVSIVPVNPPLPPVTPPTVTPDPITVLVQHPGYNARHAAVLRLYRAFLGRDPDLVGGRYWLGIADSAVSIETIVEAFSVSEEFTTTYGKTLSTEAFVRLLYINMLGREPDVVGHAYWVRQIDTGILTRRAAVQWITANAEFITRFPYQPKPAA